MLKTTQFAYGRVNIKFKSLGYQSKDVKKQSYYEALSCLNNFFLYWPLDNNSARASLMVQWLRIHLPMQGTRVRALVREDPTCHRVTKPVHPQLLSLCSGAHEPQLLSPHATTTEPVLQSLRATTTEPSCHNY